MKLSNVKVSLQGVYTGRSTPQPVGAITPQPVGSSPRRSLRPVAAKIDPCIRPITHHQLQCKRISDSQAFRSTEQSNINIIHGDNFMLHHAKVGVQRQNGYNCTPGSNAEPPLGAMLLKVGVSGYWSSRVEKVWKLYFPPLSTFPSLPSFLFLPFLTPSTLPFSPSRPLI